MSINLHQEYINLITPAYMEYDPAIPLYNRGNLRVPLYIKGESPGAPLYIKGESPGTPLYIKPVGCVVVSDVDGAKRIHCSAQKHNLELGNMIIIYCV